MVQLINAFIRFYVKLKTPILGARKNNKNRKKGLFNPFY